MSERDTLNDEQRFPLLTPTSAATLKRLREHPHAPRWNDFSGERLTAAGLERVRAYARRVETERRGWQFGELPPWVRQLQQFCRREVPFHRLRRDWSDDFFALPPINRSHLYREPWAFVPDSADLRELIVYSTSGTTGNRLRLPAHPETPNRYLPLMQLALAAHGVTLQGAPRVAVVQVHAQLRTFVMASIVSYLGGAGYAKINLNPSDWRDPLDRVRFLDDLDPEVYTGDPHAFSELLRLPLTTRPRALLSSATALLPGLRQKLEQHFGCPVVDIYSLNETGPIAFAVAGGFEILPPDLYVEILDPEGRPSAPGERGEIVLTGGCNHYLPLLRYRTGDFAALDYSHALPRLVGFQGRPPVVFQTPEGRTINSIDVTFVLRDLALPFYSLHQNADGSLRFRSGAEPELLRAAEQALQGLFGSATPLSVEALPPSVSWSGKLLQYSSDLPGEVR